MSDDILENEDENEVKKLDDEPLEEQSTLNDDNDDVELKNTDIINEEEGNNNQLENEDTNLVSEEAGNEIENTQEIDSSNVNEDGAILDENETRELAEDGDTAAVKEDVHEEEDEKEEAVVDEGEVNEQERKQEEEGESAAQNEQNENEITDTAEQNEEKDEIPADQLDSGEQENVDESELKNIESNETAGENEDFDEDNRNETPIRISEKLSRKPSPMLNDMMDDGHRDYEKLNTESPRKMEDEMFNIEQVQDNNQQQHEEGYDVDEEEEAENEEFFDREALIEQYKNAMKERESLKHKNNLIQTKLAEYFRKKKSDAESAQIKSKMEKSVLDQQEQRYLKYVSNLNELKVEMDMVQNEYHARILKMRKEVDRIEESVDKQRSDFQNLKKDVGVIAHNSRTGKAIPAKDLEQLMLQERKKDDEVVTIRLENIKLQNKLTKQDNALKSKEELGEGLHLIDFEQLKIENQTYNEKIEERNEEILKLRRKITSTVQMLTHLKEKLQFVQHEKQIQKHKLSHADETLSKKRDSLTKLKQSRDALRNDNQKLRQNCGLLGNEELLRNFEESVDTVDEKKKRLDRMKMEHAELSLTSNGLRRKIGQTKSHSANGLH